MLPLILEAAVPGLPASVRQIQDAHQIRVAVLPDRQIQVAHPARQDLPVRRGSCASDASACALPEAAEA